jgi:hypothetical protein
MGPFVLVCVYGFEEVVYCFLIGDYVGGETIFVACGFNSFENFVGIWEGDGLVWD